MPRPPPILCWWCDQHSLCPWHCADRIRYMYSRWCGWGEETIVWFYSSTTDTVLMTGSAGPCDQWPQPTADPAARCVAKQPHHGQYNLLNTIVDSATPLKHGVKIGVRHLTPPGLDLWAPALPVAVRWSRWFHTRDRSSSATQNSFATR